MNKPTVIPMAIWIMEAATLKTIAFRLSGLESVAPAAPLIKADAVFRAELILPLDARDPGTCT